MEQRLTALCSILCACLVSCVVRAEKSGEKLPSYPLDYTDYIIIGVTCAAACGLIALTVILYRQSRRELVAFCWRSLWHSNLTVNNMSAG